MQSEAIDPSAPATSEGANLPSNSSSVKDCAPNPRNHKMLIARLWFVSIINTFNTNAANNDHTGERAPKKTTNAHSPPHWQSKSGRSLKIPNGWCSMKRLLLGSAQRGPSILAAKEFARWASLPVHQQSQRDTKIHPSTPHFSGSSHPSE